MKTIMKKTKEPAAVSVTSRKSQTTHSDTPHVCFVSCSPSMYGLLMDVTGTPTGGAELQQILISRKLVEMGVSVDFIVNGWDGLGIDYTADGTRVVQSIQLPVGPKFLRALRPLLSVCRSMKSVGADVYYARGATPVAGHTALCCSMRGIPFVLGCANVTDLDGSYEQKSGAFDAHLYRFAIRKASIVIVQTMDQMELLRRNYGREGVLIRNMRTVADDVDPRSERDLVLWVGRFCKAKRPEMFVDLAARFPEQKFLMIGGPFAGETELFDEVSARAEGLTNLQLTGQLSFSETAEYFKRALLLVNTSVVEGFPNIFLEAWSEGTPTVATFDPDGLIVKHGLGSYCQDLEGIEVEVRHLLSNDEARVSMGEQAIKYVRDYHDPDKIASEFVRHMQAVIR